jgi:MoaA/NifB/PqqE/SkfB family radical SAM enzyme
MRASEWLSLGGAFASSYWAYLAESGPRPISATFHVTNRCNIRCSYCVFPSFSPNELSTAEIEVVFEKLRRAGVRRLGLAGGEPMVRTDFAEIVALAKRAGFFVSVNTNLTLYAKRGGALDSVDLVLTSLDGGEQAHKRQRGEGSWEGVIDAISDLRRRGKRVVAICVVTSRNVDQAPVLLDLADRLGIRVHFQPECVYPRTRLNQDLSNEAFQSFWRDLLTEKRRGRPIASSSAYLERLSNWEDVRLTSYLDPKTKCAAGRGFLYVDPEGNAYPCVYVSKEMRPLNLLKEDWALREPTPCTECRAGPLLEINLLYRRPIRSAIEIASSYSE